ncbi:hypothetical protein RCOM_1009950 [Ricinus communis]|uniref:NUA/TPR/MLP1-2-like domain-containing protein n=1 Tax=Ricinus communis TaxID=3988 RepID=B9SNN3_RICCO|nr:hypothetical protein RCOM_1009950 [Ricinus communis]
MAESHSVINQKLQHSIYEQENLQKAIQELKADLRSERENSMAQKEIVDLQKQAWMLGAFFFHFVTVLLKECRDIQLRCGSTGHDDADDCTAIVAVEMDVQSNAEKWGGLAVHINYPTNYSTKPHLMSSLAQELPNMSNR